MVQFLKDRAPFQLGMEGCLHYNKPGGERHGPRLKQEAGVAGSSSTFQTRFRMWLLSWEQLEAFLRF